MKLLDIKSTLSLHGYYYLVKNNEERNEEERRRRDRRIPRVALKNYHQSSFKYLFDSGNEQALLNCCATDHATFRELLKIFKPNYDRFTFDRTTGTTRKAKVTKSGVVKGRKRDLDAIVCLGLVLYWFRTRGSMARALPMAFGQTSSPLCCWLRFGGRILFAFSSVSSVS